MQDYTPPPLLSDSLERLRDYMHRFYPERRDTDPFPLAFWRNADDDTFFETLSYMPLFLREVADAGFDKLPAGFQIAFPIFWLEDDYQFNGWTALSNAGETLLSQAVAAYRAIGMASEADALAAVLAAYGASAGDDEALERAYKSVLNEYADDDRKNDAILKFFRANAHLWEESTSSGGARRR